MLRAEEETALRDPETWLTFGEAVRRRIKLVGRTLRDLATHRKVWAYGASGRATMWLNACDMDFIECVVDSSPLRIGTLMAGTHTPVVAPEVLRENPPDYIFVTAWNYFDEIRAKEPWYDGVWITPLPRFEFS